MIGNFRYTKGESSRSLLLILQLVIYDFGMWYHFIWFNFAFFIFGHLNFGTCFTIVSNMSPQCCSDKVATET